MKFEELREGYADLWNSAQFRTGWEAKAKAAARGILENRELYLQVEDDTEVPWFVVGLIHQMESDRNVKTHLHNGDPLTARTTNVPAGCPHSGRPPFAWVVSAGDALRSHDLHLVGSWPLERIAFELERYNGFRSRTQHGINTPYLWSGTNHYEKGKFIRDNVWSDDAVSAQVGALTVLLVLQTLDDAVKAALGGNAEPKPDIPPAEPDIPGDGGPAKPVLNLEELQRRLSQIPFYPPAEIDGAYGPLSQAALRGFLFQRNAPDAYQWKGQRLVIAAAQALCRLDGIDAGAVDGFLGPQTRYALDVYAGRRSGSTEPETWRDKTEGKPPLIPSPPKASNWPSEAGVDRFYGDKGENQARLKLPYPMRLAWQTDQIVTSIGCHEKLHDAVSRVLERVLSHYGPAKLGELRLDHYGGCLNIRKKRGGSAWSMHSWGIAFDFDPDHNQLRWDRERAAFARAEYDKWFELWEEEGAISLGRARDFDWMHIQFAML